MEIYHCFQIYVCFTLYNHALSASVIDQENKKKIKKILKKKKTIKTSKMFFLGTL